MTVEQYKTSVEKNMEDYRNGRFYTIAEVKAMIEGGMDEEASPQEIRLFS
jgi:hypothetical protein